MSNRTLIVLMGPTGVGKTTIGKYIEETHNDCILVSRKETSEPNDELTMSTYYDNISFALANHNMVIADDTHTLVENRSALFENICLPSETKIIGIWIESSREMAYENNNKPDGDRILNSIVLEQFTTRVSPLDSEPFDDVIYIMQETQILASRKSPAIKNIFEALKDL